MRALKYLTHVSPLPQVITQVIPMLLTVINTFVIRMYILMCLSTHLDCLRLWRTLLQIVHYIQNTMSTFIVNIYNHETNTVDHSYAVTDAADSMSVAAACGGQYLNGGQLEIQVTELKSYTLDEIEMIRM